MYNSIKIFLQSELVVQMNYYEIAMSNPNLIGATLKLRYKVVVWNPLFKYYLRIPCTRLRNETVIYVFVNSAPQNFKERGLIRKMFTRLASTSKEIESSSFQLIFSIGLSVDLLINAKIIEECRCEKDVLFLAMHDSYKFLTVKTFSDIQVCTSSSQRISWVHIKFD